MNTHLLPPQTVTDTIATAITHPNPQIRKDGLALLELARGLRADISAATQAEARRHADQHNAANRLLMAADVIADALVDFRNATPTTTGEVAA